MSPIPVNHTPHQIDATMVGGTMPWLMFYAGFMEELAKHSHQVQLNNVSGTSAGAVIGALTVVGKEHMMANILLNAFKDTGLKICWWLQWLLWTKNGVLANRTIQGTLKQVVATHVHPTQVMQSKRGLKTLHMRLKKWKLMKVTEGLKQPYKEVVWLIQNLVKYAFYRGTNYGTHEIFDSKKPQSQTKVLELLSWSFQYVPDNASTPWELLTDGEMWSWHESSWTVTHLNQDIAPESNLLVLTRFREWHKSHTAVQKQIANVNAQTKTIISPIEDLQWDLVSTDEAHMRHNLEVWRKTARMYLEALKENKR
jgi:hypothetical protein